MEVECVLECHCRLGEGPVWDAGREALFFVDIMGKAVHAFWPKSGEHRIWPVPEHVGSLGLRASGGLVLALKSGFFALDLETGAVETLAAAEADKPDNRFNDGRCDAAGRFLAGSLTYSEDRPAGALWRLDPDHSATPVLTGITVPNGLCWSPNGRTVYHTDTPTREIKAYDYDLATGTPSNPRSFARVEGTAGFPDGAVTDAEGFVWNGEWDGARVVRYAPDGTVDRIVEVPARRATSVAFGGPELTTLYVTSAWDRMSPAERDQWPLSGHLFAIEVGVRGLLEPRYRG